MANETTRSTGLLTTQHAQALASPLRSRPAWGGRTPRWVLKYMQKHEAYIPMDHYSLLVNQVTENFMQVQTGVRGEKTTLPHTNLNIAQSHREGTPLDASFTLYDRQPKSIQLEPIQTVVKVHTRIPTVYSNNYDQLKQQIDFAAEYIYETQENLLFNHSDYGLLHNVDDRFHLHIDGPPTPDLLDDMLSRVWKEPELFVMHPEALQAFHSAANAKGLVIPTIEKCDSVFSSWRGIPIFPSNKLFLTPKSGTGNRDVEYEIVDRVRGESTTNVVLLRFGEAKQGVVGLQAAKNTGSKRYPLISVDFMGIGDDAVASHLLSMYVAVAVLTPDALAVAEVVV